MTPDDNDPISKLWLQAMRAELDAVVLRFEAQLKQHVAASQSAHDRERVTLDAKLRDAGQRLLGAEREAERVATAHRQRVTELEARLSEVARRATEGEQALARSQAERDRLAREVERLRTELAARDEAHAGALQAARDDSRVHQETITVLRHQLQSLGAQVQSLGEQFAAERAFVSALLGAREGALTECAEAALGGPFEATPACYGALKSRGLEAVLTLTLRERARAVLRQALAPTELDALRAMADAAGCRLIEVARGERFAPGRMEKVAERAEPSEEGEVLECLAPGLKRADAAGSLVFPRVVVAIG